MMKPDGEDVSLALEEVAKKYGITGVRDDMFERDVGEPPSHYYTHEEVDFAESRQAADKALARLDGHIRRWGD